MEKILLFSDSHIAPFREEKFETQERNFMERTIQFFANILEEKEKGVYGKMKEIVVDEKITLGISNGDLMESLATERGWKTSRDLQAAKKTREDLKKDLGIELEMNMGNHETGYILPLSTDDGGGVSSGSIENFLDITNRGDVYYSFVQAGFRFIFVPYFFTEKIAKNFDLARMKEIFLAKMEKDLSVSREPIAIFIHDPDSLMDERLLKLIRVNREKVKAIFFGHYHSWLNLFFSKILITIFNSSLLVPCRLILYFIFWIFSGRNKKIVRELGKHFRSRKSIPAIIKELEMILIPAPTGMFGIGGGFLVLEISDNGELGITSHS